MVGRAIGGDSLMDISVIMQEGWLVSASGLGVAVAGLLGLIYSIMWRRRRLASPMSIALVLLALVGTAIAGFGAWAIAGSATMSSTAMSVAKHKSEDKAAPAEPPELGAKATINDGELGMLQKATLQIHQQQGEPGTPWPQWLGPNRDGISVETGIRTDWDQSPPKILWKMPIGDGYTSPSIAHGRLYTMDAKDKTERVLCLDPQTGKEIWSYSYPYAGISTYNHLGPKASPTIYDGLIYTLGAAGDFLCFKEASDKPQIVWKHDLVKEFEGKKSNSGYGFASSPLIEGDMVCVQAGGLKGSVVSFNRKDGKLIWKALSNMNGYSSPVAATVAGIRQIVVFLEAAAVGLRASDGAKLWEYPWGTTPGGNIAMPIVLGDYVFISSGHGDGCACLRIARDGAGCKAVPVYIMKNKVMRSAYSSCIYRDGFLYGFDVGPGNLKCIDFRTGTEKWADRRRPKGTLIYADGHLITLTETGSLIAVKATPERLEVEGTVRDIVAAEEGELWTLPVLADGLLYLRDRREIKCLDLKGSVN
jgi:outer membrane protein assembly factor BamB